ncbi:hypothetical protein OK016_16415 [Vibrio chagasii]|nr:hypothetical protein [Vibrio chagasii]
MLVAASCGGGGGGSGCYAACCWRSGGVGACAGVWLKRAGIYSSVVLYWYTCCIIAFTIFCCYYEGMKMMKKNVYSSISY